MCFSTILPRLLLCAAPPLVLAAFPLLSPAQISPLSATAKPVAAERGSSATALVEVQLLEGYHVNSHTPSDEYLIPLALTWDAAPFEVEQIVYPEPRMESYAFSGKPLSVFTGDFEIRTRLRIPADAAPGSRTLTGKLRYQAFTHNLCLPPKTLDVRLPVQIQ